MRRLPGYVGAILIGAATMACAGSVRRFSARPIVWDDDDRRPFTPAPAVHAEPYLWDSLDHMIFRPLSELWTFAPRREATNVNALDEVPDSSWFENRISRRPMHPEEIARGACEDMELDVPAPWRVVAGKPDGATPGFVFEDANGVRYVLKTDRALQREQATAADAVVAAIFHAAGYLVPCNRVVGFTEDMLELDPEARRQRTGEPDAPPRWEDVRTVLDAAGMLPDGTHRAVVSRFIEGEPLGPWSYMGTRADDPNDVVPHEDRRELRGMYVLNAWVSHWDARDTNTLSSWIAEPTGAGYVRHYLIDFGECLGLLQGAEPRAARYGHTQWLDAQHVVEDFLGLGIAGRPWHRAGRPPANEVLGYFDDRHFAPDRWRPNYWNGALERHTEADAAWMARILARFTREDIEAVVRLGRYGDPSTERELVRILVARRQRLLERYLTRLSPLADPSVSSRAREVCVTDLAIRGGIVRSDRRAHGARAYAGDPLEPLPSSLRRDGARICASLPEIHEGYLVVDLLASTRGAAPDGPLRLHFVVHDGHPTLAGLERPPSSAPPR